jgi:hypothetical protein
MNSSHNQYYFPAAVQRLVRVVEQHCAGKVWGEAGKFVKSSIIKILPGAY